MADLESGHFTDSKEEDFTPDSPISLEESPYDERKVNNDNVTSTAPQSVLVEWNGPEDVDNPQNLSVSPG